MIGYMDIGKHLRELREAKAFSQGDLEKRTGLLRSYISRVEAGHTAPSRPTLERLADALGVEPQELLRQEHGARPKHPARRPRVPSGARMNDWQRLLLRNLITEGYSKDEAKVLVELARS